MSLNPALMSSVNKHWCTPANVLERVRLMCPDGQIDLDPCSNPKSIVRATTEWWGCDDEEDGLLVQWDRGLGRPTYVFVNPPYGDDVAVWTQRCAQQALKNCIVFGLLPARTDTAWFHDAVPLCDALCLWKGRLKFLGAPSSAPFPSAVAMWGEGADVKLFSQAFRDVGWIIRN